MPRTSARFVRRFKYTQLFDGERHELVKGVDWDGDWKQLKACLVDACWHHGWGYEIVYFDGSLFFKAFYRKEGIEQSTQGESENVA